MREMARVFELSASVLVSAVTLCKCLADLIDYITDKTED